MSYLKNLCKIYLSATSSPMFLFLLVFMISSPNIQAQSSSSILRDQIGSFFGPLRENVFLHLNKTTFIKGETVWFTTYVYDLGAELPSLATSNLYVALYDSNGLEIEKKLIRIENGVGHGQFRIDEDFSHPVYYLRAWTNWMNNFKDVDAYLQSIEIINSGSKVNTLDKNYPSEDMPSVAIFFEGGKLIYSANNTIGFHVKNPNSTSNPVTSITLTDNRGNILNDGIPLDSFGYGKAEIYPEPSKRYQLKLTFDDGTEIIKALPIADKMGMNIKVKSISSSYVNLSISTNSATLEEEEGNVQFLLFRKNNRSFIKELILDSTVTQIKVSKKHVFKGLNSVTLFNSELIPRSERLFFNDNELVGQKNRLVLDHHVNLSRDSVIVKVFPNNLDSLAHLSVSVLPAKSMAYNPALNIVSSFLVQPYLNGMFNTKRNIRANNGRSLRSIDLQLLTNGGGNYSWKVIEEGNGEEKFEFESGIGLSGKILDADLAHEEQIWFYAKKAKNAFYTSLKNDKTFAIKETLYNGDSLLISVFGKKGKLRKPRAEVNFEGHNSENPVTIPKQEWVAKLGTDITVQETSISLEDQEIIDLDEVIVEASQNRTRGSFLGQANHRITQEDAKRHGSLAIYLRRLGFRVLIENSKMVVISNRFPYPVLPIFVDGIYTDGSELTTWPLSVVSDISYDSNTPKAISITLSRQGQSRGRKENYEALQIKHGYAISIPYEGPNYFSIENNVFQLFGALHWEPHLVLKAGQESHLSFPMLGQEEFILYFEGMDSDGQLISQKEFISSKEN